MIHAVDLTQSRFSSPDSAVNFIVPPSGASSDPNLDGVKIGADRHSLFRGGRRWMPVMGEMQYSRVPQSEWRDGLLKMKAGGINLVATYIFWIHHEEIEGEFDFTGQRSLRDFVTLCHELGLLVQARIGPWVHGECRNGGFPDWLLCRGHLAVVPHEAQEQAPAAPPSGWTLRTDDPDYLHVVRRLYGRIADQLRGLFWKEGGPVVGIQIENEYDGPAEHLLTLKRIALEVGFDVPLYTRTGWPTLKTRMPFGEMLPLYGGYAEGMWDRSIEPMPGGYWDGFTFKPYRIDTAIATDHFGLRDKKDERDTALYPYLTCELGGGMIVSYHRRVRIFPEDVVTQALIKLGAGNSLPGFYVYHGGTNPEGRLSTLNESQATGYPNDIPVKSYDFQAPLGDFGQVRRHYHLLRRINLFIHDYGELLASMSPVFPAPLPQGKDDVETLRWCVRSDGASAFLFVNNYQRLQPMTPKKDVQFLMRLLTGEVTLPRQPLTLPADSSFSWPVRIDLGGVELIYATAEIICNLDVENIRYVFFAQTEGVPAHFGFDTRQELTATGKIIQEGDLVHVEEVPPGLGAAIRLKSTGGRETHIVLLDAETSLRLWKEEIGGRSHLALTSALPLPEIDSLRCQMTEPADAVISFLPAPKRISIDGATVSGQKEGLFHGYALPSPLPPPKISVEQIRKAAPARVVPMGPFGVAEAPADEEFERAAVWRLRIPADARKLLLRVHYLGDVARFYLNGRLLTDNFYNGTPFELGVGVYAPEIYQGELLLKILPLRHDAPIYLLEKDRSGASDPEGTAEIHRIEVISTTEVRLDFGLIEPALAVAV